MPVRLTRRAPAVAQLLSVVAVVLLIAFDATTAWVVPVLLVFAAAVLVGERSGNHDAPDDQIEALTGGAADGAPDLRIAVVLAVVLYAAVLAGAAVALTAETCSALLLPFSVAVGSFGALRLHVAMVLARG